MHRDYHNSHSPWGKGYKLYNFVYMQDVSLEKGECLILGVPKKVEGFKVNHQEMLSGISNKTERNCLRPGYQKGVSEIS